MNPFKKKISNESVLFIVMIAVIGVITLINHSFLTAYNFIDMLRSCITDGMFAVGAMMVIISGGIDVSFPAIGAFAMYSTTIIFNKIGYEGNVVLPFIVAMAMGVAMGALNALLVHTFKIQTFIATLGTSNVICGILLTFIGSDAIMKLPKGFTRFAKASLITVPAEVGYSSLPIAFLILVGLVIVAYVIINHTMLGRGIYAIGGNVVAAERVGFHVGLIRLFIFCFSGAIAGAAGLTHTCLFRTSNPFDIIGSELTIIAAVVLGGTNIAGGRGTIRGTMLGVFMITIISNSLIMIGISTYWQRAVLGLLIMFSVSITAFQNLRSQVKGDLEKAGDKR